MQESDEMPLAPVAAQLPQKKSILQQDQIPDMEAMEEGMPLEAQYIEFQQPGESIRAILCGWSSMDSKKGGTIPVAMLQNKEGIFANAGMSLTKQLMNVEVGTPVSIVYEGSIKTASGNNVKKYSVKVLVTPTKRQRVDQLPVARPTQARAPQPQAQPAQQRSPLSRPPQARAPVARRPAPVAQPESDVYQVDENDANADIPESSIPF